MLFFGWLRRQKAWTLANGDLLIRRYEIGHIMWTFRWITNRKWLLKSINGQITKIKKNEAKELMGGALPKLKAYERAKS